MGGVDIVVLSASVQIHKDFLEQTEADIALQFQINLVSNIQLLQQLIPQMRTRAGAASSPSAASRRSRRPARCRSMP